MTRLRITRLHRILYLHARIFWKFYQYARDTGDDIPTALRWARMAYMKFLAA